MARVVAVAARIEAARTREGPVPLLARLRAEGGAKAARPAPARLRLDRAVGFVDRRFPGGGNCYRRVLLTVALDAGAAGSPVMFGLKAGGGPGSGHAYFKGDELGRAEAAGLSFDTTFEL